MDPRCICIMRVLRSRLLPHFSSSQGSGAFDRMLFIDVRKSSPNEVVVESFSFMLVKNNNLGCVIKLYHKVDMVMIDEHNRRFNRLVSVTHPSTSLSSQIIDKGFLIDGCEAIGYLPSISKVDMTRPVTNQPPIFFNVKSHQHQSLGFMPGKRCCSEYRNDRRIMAWSCSNLHLHRPSDPGKPLFHLSFGYSFPTI